MARVCIVVVLVSLAVCGTWAEQRCTPHSVESHDNKYARETIPGALRVTSVRVVQQNSKSGCTQGTSYGIIGPDVWVDHGCRAIFDVCYETVTHSCNGIYGSVDTCLYLCVTSTVECHCVSYEGYTTTVKCESNNHQTATCNTGGFIRLLTIKRQYSKSACVEGDSFFKSDNNIIVSKGCRADFLVGF